jgi:hypothetical protein
MASGVTVAPAAASEVAGYSVPSGCAARLMPMPSTSQSSPRSASARDSSRIPATFAPPSSTSLGHLQRISASTGSALAQASATASAAAKPSCAASAAAERGRSTNEQ